jgi:hypothetical protein
MWPKNFPWHVLAQEQHFLELTHTESERPKPGRYQYNLLFCRLVSLVVVYNISLSPYA